MTTPLTPLTVEQLEALAGRANELLLQELRLFAIEPRPTLPVISPAMVRAVLQAAAAELREEDAKAATKRVMSEETKAKIRASRRKKPASPDQIVAGIAQAHAHLNGLNADEVRQALQALAVGHVLPTAQVWDAQKPAHLPGMAALLEQLGLSTLRDLAKWAGLRYIPARYQKPEANGVAAADLSF